MVAMDQDGTSERSPMSTHDAVHHSMHAKGLSPKSNVTVILREVYAFGQCEVGYRKAQEMGVRFIRSETVPTMDDGGLVVKDMHSGLVLRIPADLVVVDNRSESVGTEVVARAFQLPLASDGGMARSNPKCRPVSAHIPGILLCGSASEMNLGAGSDHERKGRGLQDGLAAPFAPGNRRERRRGRSGTVLRMPDLRQDLPLPRSPHRNGEEGRGRHRHMPGLRDVRGGLPQQGHPGILLPG